MRLPRIVFAAAIAASLLAPRLAAAAGYGIYEQGAAVLGMAGAGTASVHDASANFYDPAALARLRSPELQVGGTWLQTRVSFAGIDPYPGYGVTEDMKAGNFFPPTVYYSQPFRSKWTLGVGVNAPFGLGVDWKNPDTFTDRAYVTKATLRSIDGNVNLAYEVLPQLDVAVGFDMLFAGVELWRTSPAGVAVPGSGGEPLQVRTHLKGGYSHGNTGNFAVLWTPDPSWRFGLNYRGRAHVNIDNGNADFALVPTGNAMVDQAAAAGIPPAQKVTTTLFFPALVSMAAAWQPMPGWTYELDVNHAGWSWFKSLDIAFDQSNLNTTVEEDYRTSWRVSLGAERRLPTFTYRFGYYFDEAAAPVQSVSALLPDANRHGVTGGLSRPFGASKAWTLDVYELALFVEDRSTEGQSSHGFDGVYKSYVNACGASVAYRW